MDPKPIVPEPIPLHSTSLNRSLRLSDFFTVREGARTRYSDFEIRQVSNLLKDDDKFKWSQVPRLYTILRTIGQLHVLDNIIEQGINDYWFPFDVKSAPTILSASMRNQFVESQSLVLTKAVDLEKSPLKHHAHFGKDDIFPFDIGDKIGSGAFGTIDKVTSHFSHREFARKRFPRKKGGTKSEIQSFRTELQVLKRIQHQHCAELV